MAREQGRRRSSSNRVALKYSEKMPAKTSVQMHAFQGTGQRGFAWAGRQAGRQLASWLCERMRV